MGARDAYYDKRKLESLLAEAATGLAPRLFAIYGVYNEPDPDIFLGWGMDFGGERGAIYYSPEDNSTWRSSSAEEIWTKRQLFCNAKLHWLTDWPEPVSG